MEDDEYASHVLENMFKRGMNQWEATARTYLRYGYRWTDKVGLFSLFEEVRNPLAMARYACSLDGCRGQIFALLQDAVIHERDHIEAWYQARKAFLPWRNRGTALVLGDAISLWSATLAGLRLSSENQA